MQYHPHLSTDTDTETKLFCCRAMTGAIVLYDHVDPGGVFYSKSNVNVSRYHINTDHCG